MLDVFVLLPKDLHFSLKIRQKVCIVLVVEETALIQSRNNLQTINIFLFFFPQFLWSMNDRFKVQLVNKIVNVKE